MDGTLINSERLYHEVVGELCAKYGKVYTKELQTLMYGRGDHDICSTIVKTLNIDVTPEKFEEQLNVIADITLPKAPLQKGVERLLTHLHATNVPMALATNSTSHAVELHAKAKPQIFKVFSHKVCVTDPGVKRGKPHPDLYLVAASMFKDKPDPAKCLVFEDSPVGLQAGKDAGMQVIWTPHRHFDDKHLSEATQVLPNLSEFKPELFGLPAFPN